MCSERSGVAIGAPWTKRAPCAFLKVNEVGCHSAAPHGK